MPPEQWGGPTTGWRPEPVLGRSSLVTQWFYQRAPLSPFQFQYVHVLGRKHKDVHNTMMYMKWNEYNTNSIGSVWLKCNAASWQANVLKSCWWSKLHTYMHNTIFPYTESLPYLVCDNRSLFSKRRKSVNISSTKEKANDAESGRKSVIEMCVLCNSTKNVSLYDFESSMMFCFKESLWVSKKD